MARLGIDRDFLWEFGKLERQVQDKVYETFARFEQATHAGIHLESIRNARDSRLRSVRIDRFWRGIVLAPDSGDSYTLLKVLPHDDAYAWAQRTQVTVNRANGVIELRDVVAIEERLPQLAETAATTPSRLLADVSDADLVRLGIDEQLLPFARALTHADQLESSQAMLPEPQYDVLLGLAMGMAPEQVWDEVAAAMTTTAAYDPDDVTSAVERSSRRVVLVSGPDELMEVFSYPFAQWRVYLHPAQRRAAYGTYSGPARVTGGPGTGKTVAALHRARHLAESSPVDRSVLLTTFTKTLAASLENSLRLLIDDEAVLRRIDIRHLDQLAYQVTSRAHGRLHVLSPTDDQQRWEELIDRHDLDVSAAFLRQEWHDVVLAQNLNSLEAYRSASRVGRGQPLGAGRRAPIWQAMSEFSAELRDAGWWTYETICIEATRLLVESGEHPYRHIVVDEAQDFSPWRWRLVRAAAPSAPDDLFLAGDTHQRIYGHRVTLKQVGIDITGRSERLKINYRTTAEILAWSLGVLRGESVDDMNEGLDTLAGCRSQIHGEPPTLCPAVDKAEELAQLAATVADWRAAGVAADQIGVTARTTALVEEAVRALESADIAAVSLAKRQAKDNEVHVASMHRMKGLEFRCVAVIGASQNQLPPASAVTPATEDQRTHDLDIQRERCLLFVACTRAREQLTVSWHGARSALLPR